MKALRTYFSKMKGGGTLPPAPGLTHVGRSFLGGTVAIAATGWLTLQTGSPWLMAPFGASCVLVFGVPESPLSQPRNVVLGHLLSALVAMVCLKIFGTPYWAMGLAVGTAIALMQLTRTVHAPAGATALVVMMSAPGWLYLVNPVLLGSLVIVGCAVLFNNMSRSRAYPAYWI